MKNSATRSAPRAEFSVSGSSNSKTRNVPDTTTPAQAGSSDPLAGDGIGIASFWKSPRNRTEAIQVSLKSYQGHPYLDARVYTTNAAGRMIPTSRGIAVGVKTLAQFTQAIGAGYRKAAALGLLLEKSS
jgi:hypothetical protein